MKQLVIWRLANIFLDSIPIIGYGSSMTNLLHTLYKGSHSWLADNTILLVRHGSRAYGTNTPTSDTDIKGICVAPLDNYLGLGKDFEQAEFKSEETETEGVVYELRKFMKLAAECNPNILEVLFVADEDVLFCSPAGQLLRDNRDMFVSKKARHTFAGYAQSQLKRIKGHRAWLLNPPKGKPERVDFELPEKGMGPSEMGALNSLEEKGHVFSESAVGLLQKEKAYFNALQEWKNYEGWKKSRNPARAELEAKCGYDSKHAMHLVRLLTMCSEILRGKGVLVKRTHDVAKLLDIRSGSWTYEQVIALAEQLESQCNVAAKFSTLPEECNRQAVSDLCVQLIKQHHGVYGAPLA
jgi:uncharacterized protein